MSDEVERQWLERLGPTLDENEVIALLNITSDELDADRATGHVLALPTSGEYRYPVWQLDNGAKRTVTLEIVTAFSDAEVSPYMVASWAVSPQPELSERDPASWITEGGDSAPVVFAAQRAAHLESR